MGMDDILKSVKETAETIGTKTVEIAKDVGTKASELTTSSSEAIVKALDQNGDGEVNIEDVILLALKTPGVRVDRKNFLEKEFQKNHTPEEIEDIVEHNPAHANIDKKEIDKIADAVIQYERVCVSGISTALGMPGGVAMAATIPTDIAQYYAYMLRAAQKLMYLYGFPEIPIDEQGQVFDSETLNVLVICLGVMYGAAGASTAIKAMAKGLAVGVEKQLMKKALTKGTIYPIVKSISKWFGKKMTKEVFAGFFKKSIPVLGGIIGGGITYLSFKPCCDKLRESLEDTMLSNPNHVASEEENEIIIDADEVEVVSEDIDDVENLGEK